MSIPVSCGCGHRWNVSDALLGLAVQCPHCRSQCPVEATAIMPFEGVASPAASSDALSAHPPAPRAQANISPNMASRGTRRIGLLIGAAVMLILCAVGVGAGWLYFRGDPAVTSADLPFIKTDAALIASVRVADYMAQPGGKRMREILEKFGGDDVTRIEKFLGISAGDVERVTLVVPDLKGGSEYAVVLLKKPANLSRFGSSPSFVAEKSGELTYHRYKSLALYQKDLRLFVVGTNDGVKAALANVHRPAEPSAAPFLEKLRGAYHAVIHLKIDPATRDQWLAGDFGERRQPKADLLGESMTLSVRETKELRADLEIKYASAEKAKSGKVALEHLRRMVDEMVSRDAPDVVRDVVRELRDVAIEQSGATVATSLKTTFPFSVGWLDSNNRDSLKADEREITVLGKEIQLRKSAHRPNVALLYSRIHRGLQFLPEFAAENRAVGNSLEERAWRDVTRVPGAYYYYKGPFGQVMQKVTGFRGWGAVFCDTRLPAALIGQYALAPATAAGLAPAAALWSDPPLAVLGIENGSPAAYARPFQTIDFYESNPELIDVSLPRRGGKAPMTFVQDAIRRGANVRVFKGDLRDTFAAGPKHFYGVVLVEGAPCADSAVMEPLDHRFYTRQGMKLVLEAMNPEGIACYHNSHRYLTLDKPLAAAARECSAVAWSATDQGGWNHGDPNALKNPLDEAGHFASQWVMIANDQSLLQSLEANDIVRGKSSPPPGRIGKGGVHPENPPGRYWERLDPDGVTAWTDGGETPIGEQFRSDPHWSATYPSVSGIVRVWFPPTAGFNVWSTLGPGSELDALFLESFRATNPTTKWFDQHRP